MSQATPTNIELVLVLQRATLAAQGIDHSGIQTVDFEALPHNAYGFMPRHILGNKSDDSIEIGRQFPQPVIYSQIFDAEGNILVYQRKSKDKLLQGKWSIGVGGHVDITDKGDSEVFQHIFLNGAIRELKEEIGLDTDESDYHLSKIIASDIDKTAQVHVGFLAELHLNEIYNPVDKSTLEFEAAEYPVVRWMSIDELKEFANSEDVTFEPWSQLIIADM